MPRRSQTRDCRGIGSNTPPLTIEQVQTLIVGGGQAGLVMSHMLTERSCPHLVLERGRIGERWRAERWDGLRFQFPNWSVRLPDFPYLSSNPDGFATSAEILDYLNAYAAKVKPPIRCGVQVSALHRDGSAFLADTPEENIAARNVVVATGPYQRPIVPDLLRNEDIFQIHASAYKAPDQLPAGAVLIVGSGASGAQIADELLRAGRRVLLSVGRHKRMPRRYRGYDLIWWLSEMGLDQTPVAERGPDAILPLITGAYGGHTIDLRAYAEQGIALLGRLRSAAAGILYFAEDLRPASPTATPPTALFWTGQTPMLSKRGCPCQSSDTLVPGLPIRPVCCNRRASSTIAPPGSARSFGQPGTPSTSAGSICRSSMAAESPSMTAVLRRSRASTFWACLGCLK